MAIKKTKTETFRVKASRAEAIELCARAMDQAGFKNIARNDEMGRLSGKLRKLGSYGEADLTLTDGGNGTTEVELTSTTNVDNVWAIGGPNKRLIQRLKASITDVSAE